ncbi:MAG: diguanylate cyclase [Deltaproteobacteria bacterium]|nr:diguanylate cyclase [Nannocystaceae bacterium]
MSSALHELRARGSRRSSTASRLAAIGFALTLAVSAGIGLQAVLLHRQLNETWQGSMARAESLIAAQQLAYRFEQKVASSRAYLLTGEPRFLAETEVDRAAFLQVLARLSSAATLTEERAVLTALGQHELAHEAVLTSLQRNDARLPPSDLRRLFLEELKPIRDALDRDLDEFNRYQHEQMAEAQEAASATAAHGAKLAIGTSVAAIVVGSLLAGLFTRMVRRAQSREELARAEAVGAQLLADARAHELEHRARIFAILEAVPAGVFVLAADGQPYYANARARALLGSSEAPDVCAANLTLRYRAYVIGTNEVYPSDRAPIVRALHGEHTSVSDMEIDRDGHRTALQVEARPVLSPDGRVEFAVAAFVDVEALRRQALEDPLTRLSNRAALDEAFERVRSVCVRSAQPLTVAMLDLDRFKSVNDRHGHAVGDEVLARVADILRSSVRSSDVLGRWGGEELALLLPVTGVAGAEHLLEKLLETVCRVRFIGRDGEAFHVSFSAGVAEVRPSDGSLADAMRGADAALYAAKADGRACVRRHMHQSLLPTLAVG